MKIRLELEGPNGDQVVAPVWFTAWTMGKLPSNSSELVFRKSKRIRADLTDRNLISKSLGVDGTIGI